MRVSRFFIITLSLALSFVISINIFYVSIQNDNIGTMGQEKNENAIIKDVPDNITVFNTGSSHGYYGFDYSVVDHDSTCFNFALPMQTLSYDYRVLNFYKDQISQNGYAFIIVSHFSLFQPRETDQVNFESKNRRYYRFLDSSNIKDYQNKVNLYVNYMPALIAYESLFGELISSVSGKYYDNDWDHILSEDNKISNAENRYQIYIQSNYNEEEHNWIINEEEYEILIKTIYLCKEKNITPILITMPVYSEYYDLIMERSPLFFDEFHGTINEICESEDVLYYDYENDSRISDQPSLFMDCDHLNHEGAKLFTKIIFSEVIEQMEEKKND